MDILFKIDACVILYKNLLDYEFYFKKEWS